VRLQWDSFTDPEDGSTADVSAGGMFVNLADPKPVGTRLRFWLTLPDQPEPISGFGEVVWIRVANAGPESPRGVGIEFRYLADPDRERIRSEVARIVVREGLPREPTLSKEDLLMARRQGSTGEPHRSS
jgi:uncharacterized protein (TIGR02266 family)